MQIAIVRRIYNPFGGAEKFVERLSKDIVRSGSDVTIITEHWKPVDTAGLKVLPVSTSGISRAKRLLDFQLKAKEIFALQKFDIVQTHERLLGADVYRLGDGIHRAWLNRMAREATWAYAKWLELDPYHRLVLATEKKMAEDVGLHFVANSSMVADEIQDFLSVPADRITLIPNGVNTSRFLPATPEQKESARLELSVPKDAFVVGFVGSGFQRKGVFRLVEAFRHLPDCYLLICGKDKEEKRLLSMIDKFRLNHRVRYIGPRNDVTTVLWASDVFCLPSTYDPSSNAVLEALSCGLPVIGTADAGTLKDLSATGAGLLCSREPEDIADKIQALASTDSIQEMSKKARDFAKSHDQSEIINRWLAFYHQRFSSCRFNRFQSRH